MTRRIASLLFIGILLTGCACRHIQPPPEPPEPDGAQANPDAFFEKGVADHLSARDASDERTRLELLRRARASYLKALEISPNDPATLNNLADVEAQLGNVIEAVKRYDSAATIDVRQERAFSLRRSAELVERLDRNNSKQRYWGAATEDPSDRDTYRGLARLADERYAVAYSSLLVASGNTELAVNAAAEMQDRLGEANAAAVAAKALADAAGVLSAKEARETAEPVIAAGGSVGQAIDAVISLRPVSREWLEQLPVADATGELPAKAFRRLAHAIGSGVTANGDPATGEKYHRLAMTMPGTDVNDVVEVIDHAAGYASAEQLDDSIRELERGVSSYSLGDQAKFHQSAAVAYALAEECDSAVPHIRRLNAIGGAVPAYAAKTCKANLAPSVPAVPETLETTIGNVCEPRYKAKIPIPGIVAVLTKDSHECEHEAVRALAADTPAGESLIVETVGPAILSKATTDLESEIVEILKSAVSSDVSVLQARRVESGMERIWIRRKSLSSE